MTVSFSRKLTSLLLFILFLNLFLFHSTGVVPFILKSIGFLGFLLTISLTKPLLKTHKTTLAGATISLLLIWFSLVSRDNSFISSFLQFVSLILLILTSYLLASQTPFFSSLSQLILAPLNFALSFIRSGINLLKLTFTSKSTPKPSKLHRFSPTTINSLLIGALITIPVITILLAILSSADPIFATKVKLIFSLDFLKNIPHRIFRSIAWLIFFSPFLVLKIKNTFISPFTKISRLPFTAGMSLVTASVAATLAAFIIIQFPYVFASVSAETDLSQFGVNTYSEYVQKGFSELLIAAGFIFSIIWAGLVFLRGAHKPKRSPLFWLQLVVLSEFAVFLASIYRRVFLYQAHHGLSLVRIYGSFFLAWIAFITLTLAARHLWPKVRWVTVESVLTMIVILALGLTNTESLVVTTPPTVNNNVDYVYLARLSADGYQGWLASLDHAESILTNPDLESQDTIGRDDRRQIIYAGLILQKLTHNYHDLAEKYATDPEWQTYYTAYLNHQINILDAMISNTKLLIEDRRLYPARKNVDYNKELATITYRQELEQQEKARNTYQLALEKLDQDDFNSDTALAELRLHHIHFYSSFNLCTITKRPSTFQVEHKRVPQCHSFYNFSDFESVQFHRLGRLNHLFVKNLSQQKAYNNIKTQITPDRLFNLQTKYLNLYRKIALQPTDQQDFDQDISLDSPFLEPLDETYPSYLTPQPR